MKQINLTPELLHGYGTITVHKLGRYLESHAGKDLSHEVMALLSDSKLIIESLLALQSNQQLHTKDGN